VIDKSSLTSGENSDPIARSLSRNSSLYFESFCLRRPCVVSLPYP